MDRKLAIKILRFIQIFLVIAIAVIVFISLKSKANIEIIKYQLIFPFIGTFFIAIFFESIISGEVHAKGIDTKKTEHPYWYFTIVTLYLVGALTFIVTSLYNLISK